MKKVLMFLLCAILACGSFGALSGCKVDSIEQPPDQPKKEEVTYKRPAIGVDVCSDVRKSVAETDVRAIQAVEVTNLSSEGTANLFDKNENTSYVSALTAADEKTSLTVDLRTDGASANKHLASGIYYIDRLDITPYREDGAIKYFPQDFDVEISADGVNWTVVAARKNYTAKNDLTILFAAQSARYIKINVTKAKDGKVALGEISLGFDWWFSEGKFDSVANASYYVSYSGGNDANSGLSAAYPFKTLNRVNALKLKPGNKILLKKGDVWTGENLMPSGDGTAVAPIIIGAYGEGEKPVIRAGKGMAHGIRLFNSDYYEISGLSFKDSVSGILATSFFKNYNQTDDSYQTVNGLKVTECSFENLNGNRIIYPTEPVTMRYPDGYFGGGILISGYNSKATSGDTTYNNIVIENNNFLSCDVGVINTLNDMHSSYGDTIGYFDTARPTEAHATHTTSSVTNLTIKNLDIRKSLFSGGIMIYGTKNGLIDNVFIDETGIEGMPWGVAACQLSLCEDFVVSNSLFNRTYLRNGSVDGEGFDFESGNKNILLKDTVISNNEGPAFLAYGQNMGWHGTNTQNRVENCVLVNNGLENTNDHAKVFKDYPDTNKGGYIQDSDIVLNYEGQGYQAGYRLTGNQTDSNTNGVYDEASDTTLIGMDFKQSNNVYNPTALEVTKGDTVVSVRAKIAAANSELISGENYSAETAGKVSTGKSFTVDKPQNIIENAAPETDPTTAMKTKYSLSQLSDGETGGNYYYNTGFSTKPMIGEDLSLSLTMDLGKITEINQLRLYGVTMFPAWGKGSTGCLLPKGFYIEGSTDGVTYEKINIIGIEGGEYTDFDPKNKGAHRIDFQFSEVRYFRFNITKARENPAKNGEFAVRIAEIELYLDI